MRHLSVYKDHEAEKEAVAVNAVYACADWLREHGEPEIAERLESEMLLEVEDDRA